MNRKSKLKTQTNHAPPVLPTLDDGRLQFVVRRRDGSANDDAVYALDLLLVKLACEQLEAKHQLPTLENGQLQPTPEFLIDLAERLDGLGLAACTPTLAWQVWQAASHELGSLKKNMNGTPS